MPTVSENENTQQSEVHQNADDEFQDCQTADEDSSSNVTSNKPSSNSNGENCKVNQRRTRIPNKPPFTICWKSLALSWGKVFPLGIYEPLTILQRSAQVFEYADLLHRAAECSDDPLAEMKYVVAFVFSGHISCSTQSGKPFTSFKGETYECDRMEDLGWRLASEQVSHEPSIYAQMIEASGWTCQQEYTIKTHIKPHAMCAEGVAKGRSILAMKRSGNRYTWTKLPIVAKVRLSGLNLEHTGELVISNETTGDACNLTFHKSNREVTGKIKSKDGQLLEELKGNWDSHLETINQEPLWRRTPLDDGAMSYYGFSRFACQLNEPDGSVAPTDSRRRKDIRYLEEGESIASSEEKNRLNAKYANNHSSVSRKPLWFDPPKAKNEPHTWNNKYWKCKQVQDWSACPRMFDD